MKPTPDQNGLWWAMLEDSKEPTVVQIMDGAVWIIGQSLDVPFHHVRLLERVEPYDAAFK